MTLDPLILLALAGAGTLAGFVQEHVVSVSVRDRVWRASVSPVSTATAICAMKSTLSSFSPVATAVSTGRHGSI